MIPPSSIPTPEQAHDLVAWAGSQETAARAIDVPRSTLRHWLDPTVNHARNARYRKANAERERERHRDYFAGLSGVAYNRRLLYMRRVKALHRRAKREQEEATVGPL